MYYDQTDDNKKGKILAILASLCYILLWVLLIIFISFENTNTEESGGILIDFGDSELSEGTRDLAYVEAEVVSEPEPTPQVEEQTLTQDFEPAPQVEATPEIIEPTPELVEPEPKPREVNKAALFRGNTAQSPSKSEGESTGEGNQGHEAGLEDGSKQGMGQSTEGHTFDLRGRNLIGKLPLPSEASQEYGQVVIRIVVSSRGDVTSADFQSSGSTTQNSVLVAAAIEAAKKAKFNLVDTLTPQQGTITYVFKLQ
ncbi:MAG: TonB family protein [Rikenellaceae bacterium]